MYIPWVLWGDGANSRPYESSSLWCAEMVGFPLGRPGPGGLYLMLMGWNDHENRVKRVAYPGYKATTLGHARLRPWA